MIEESYVSLETAKLLKENGFDAECHSYYYPYYEDDTMTKKHYDRDRGTITRSNKLVYEVHSIGSLPKDHYLCPTIQVARKWVESFGYIIYTYPEYDGKEIWWRFNIWFDNSDMFLGQILEYGTEEKFDSNEEALDGAIKYSLEHLIGEDRDMMMEKPDESVFKELTFGLRYGREMRDERYHAGETTWTFPKGIQKKISDDKLYRIWYKRHDPADSSDMSVDYTVYYIEDTKKNEV